VRDDEVAAHTRMFKEAKRFPYYYRKIFTPFHRIGITVTISRSWFQTFAMLWMLYSSFWVISLRMNFMCRRFGTLSLFHLH